MTPRMTYRQHARAVLTLGLPLIGSHVAQFAITLTDAVMLGWYSVEALAAEVLGGTLFFVLFIMGSGFAWAVMPMVAAAQAADDQTQIRRVTRMGAWASLLFGLATLPLMVWSTPVFLALGQDPAISGLAGQYLSIMGWGILPALWVMVLKSYLAALERTQVVLWVTVAAVGLNIMVNHALIFGNWGAPELGVRGAAIASLTVNIASLVALALYVMRVAPDHALFQRFWRPDAEALRAVFRLGWPIGITNLAEVGLFAASSVMMGWLGTVPLAAHGIALQITSVVFMVHMGLSNAATVRAGQAHGRGDRRALRDGAAVVLGLSLATAALTMGLFFTLPDDDLLSPWDLTVYRHAGAFLLFCQRLRSGEDATDIREQLVKGLNRIFCGMMMDESGELFIASSGGDGRGKIASVLHYQIPAVAHRRNIHLTFDIRDDGAAPRLVVRDPVTEQSEASIVGVLDLQLTHFEYLMRVARGSLPASFSRQCFEDFLDFKLRLIERLDEIEGDANNERYIKFQAVTVNAKGYAEKDDFQIRTDEQ